MSGDHCRHSRRQFSFHYVQISAAHAARTHSKEDVARRRIRLGDLLNPKRAG
jgi:hypothetical protein